MRNKANLISCIDWYAVIIYLLLIIMGWMNIYAAVSDSSLSGAGFELTSRYGMQLIWIGITLSIAVVILLIDAKFWHIFSAPMYIFSLLVLVSTLIIGREVNGAKSWLILGPVAFQPAELMKFTTSLMLARGISSYNFKINQINSLALIGGIIMLPIMVIILQNDTGSAIVYASFFFVLAREGLGSWVYILMGTVIALFVLSFLLTPFVMMILILLFCLLCEGIMNGNWKSKIVYLASLTLGYIAVFALFNFIFKVGLSHYASLLVSVVLSLVGVFTYIYRYKLVNVVKIIGLFFASLGFTNIVDYVFDNILQTHQQKRILDLLGIEQDLRGWGYNVNQSKIAIGSGGFWGKGYLNGTQTKYNFVPEQSTDFIFCTVGEEWGFMGSLLVVTLFCMLILRLMKMGERQMEAFGRVYCYSVAGIFLIHLLINIGMTIGIMPVIGIPLMFFSYGGSSFLMFSIMFFVAVKLDASYKENLN
ncbi:MAG: rod shape-determining protein RodA [Rikenellaceae bacterium]